MCEPAGRVLAERRSADVDRQLVECCCRAAIDEEIEGKMITRYVMMGYANIGRNEAVPI